MKSSNSPVPEAEQEQPRRLEDILASARIWRVQRLAMREKQVASPSGGEQVLPWLILLMYACCIAVSLIGLASAGIGGHELILPLWTPFFLMGVTYTVLLRLPPAAEEQQQRVGVIGAVVAALLLLFICWARFYSANLFFLDPRWLLTFFSDLLFLGGKAFLLLFVCLCSGLMMWQVVRVSLQKVEPSQCTRLLIIGLVLLGLTILIRLATPYYPSLVYANIFLLVLIPLYISLGLGAHALAHIVLLRRFHPGGLDGSRSHQERSLVVALTAWGLLLLLVALLLSAVISPDFLTFMHGLFALLGTVYDWLVLRLADLLTFLVTPLIWLLSFFHYSSGFPSLKRPRDPVVVGKRSPVPIDPGAVLMLSKFLLVLLIVLLVILIGYLMKWGRQRIAVRKVEQDLHESVWSWALFRHQLWLLLLALFGRFFRKRSPERVAVQVDDLRTLEPTARTIREIYRALLKQAARVGLPRQKSETPGEFRLRLSASMPEAEQGLRAITEAYLDTRYGGVVPGEEEVARVRQNWLDVEQKWSDIKL